MCGIFGIISKKPRAFDYTSFCTLGIHNDLRGGDSCGVFIDKKVEYGVNKDKLFEDFFLKSNLINNTKISTVAFGHCRKASIGTIEEKTAQPVVLYNDKGEIDFVVIHNGTIYNYQNLANKYIPDIDITGMTDSQVMTRIFYYKGYDVLSEYNGGAVFAIADYRKETPEIFFWQGASLVNAYGKVDDERPLYFAISKNDLVFSSIYTFLPALRKDSEIVCLTPNWLYKYENNNVEPIKEYSRENQTQYNTTIHVYTQTWHHNPAYGPNITYSSGQQQSSYVSSVIYGSTKDGKCFRNGDVVHGNIKATCYGTLTSCGQLYDMWFWCGIMLNNKACFDYLSMLSSEFGANPQELADIYPELVLFLSPYPYLRTLDGAIEVVDSPISSVPFTGTFQFPFTATEYQIVDGKLHMSKVTTQFDGLKLYLEKRDSPLPLTELINNFGDYNYASL